VHLGPGVIALKAFAQKKSITIKVGFLRRKETVAVRVETVAALRGTGVDGRVRVIAVFVEIETVPILIFTLLGARGHR
jgi:hypothetical protein